MGRIILSVVLLIGFYVSSAVSYSGIYSFNKGMNKASGSMYLSHFKEDSAFFILQTVSGMPDFYTTEIKGFMRIENGVGLYIGKDSASIQFSFKNNLCILLENSYCKNECCTNGKYTKTSVKLKKANSLLPTFSDKKGFVKADSTWCLSAPNISAPPTISLNKNQDIQITDEHNGFYLIEIKNKKNEFLSVPKKQIQLLKNR